MKKAATPIETRVLKLERQVAELKSRTDALGAQAQSIPGLLNTNFQSAFLQFARLRTETAEARTEFSEFRRAIEERFDQLLSAMTPPRRKPPA